MSDTIKRIIVACVLVALLTGIIILEYIGINATRHASVLVVAGMIFEFVRALVGTTKKVLRKNLIGFCLFGLLLIILLGAAYCVASRPWIMLLLLITICGADIGAWFFGKIFGGDKMWERLSGNKTWAGQIAGIICGTFMCVMYGLLGADAFMPQLLWIGISVSLLSQYGDLSASWIKRKIGIKDFGTVLPGHGGLLDRFDGWIYALPLIWMILL